MEARDVAAPAWTTPTFFALIAIGVVLALAIIIWGTIRRRAKAAERRRAEAHAPHQGVAAPDAELIAPPPAAPEAPPPAAPLRSALPAEGVVPIAPRAAPAIPAAGVAASEEAAAPAPAATEARPLTLLKGLGPKVAARLADLGVTSIDALAARSDAELAALDAALGPFAGRIARDRWGEQARLLAARDVAGFEARFGKLGG